MSPLATAFATLLAACSSQSEPSVPSDWTPPPSTESGEAERPDIVVAVPSYLRADRGNMKGAGTALLDAFGREPTLLASQTYVHSTAVYVSLGSMLTGRYPSNIPLCSLSAGADRQGQHPWCTMIPETRMTLPQVLAYYGYRTGFFSSGLDAHEWLAPRFEHAEAIPPAGDALTDWPTLSKAALAWWTEDDTRPRLLVLSVNDLDLFADSTLRPTFDAYSEQYDPTGPKRRLPPDSPLTRLGDDLRRAYVERATQVGSHLGELAENLPNNDRGTWTIITSSRGASIGEHLGLPGDGLPAWGDNSVVDRSVRVPLAIYGPPGTKARPKLDYPTEIVDLFPTVGGLADVVLPAGLPGEDLLGPSRGNTRDQTAYVEFGDQFAVRKGEDLLVLRAFLHHSTPLDPALTTYMFQRMMEPALWGFYNVQRDPEQVHNMLAGVITEGNPTWEQATLMREEMLALRQGPAAPPQGVLTPERLWEIRMSQSAGYW